MLDDEDSIETMPPPPGVTGPCRALFCSFLALPADTRCERHSQRDPKEGWRELEQLSRELDSI